MVWLFLFLPLKLKPIIANLPKDRDAKLKGLFLPTKDGSQLPKEVLTVRKLLALLLTVCLITLAAPAAALAAKDDSGWLNETTLDKGAVGIHYEAASKAQVKVMITKDGTSYTYDLKNDGTEEFFPLQLGNGTYKIMVLENTTGNKYKSVHSASRELKLEDDSIVFLNAVQNINWSDATEVVKKAKELTEGKEDDTAKVQAIYDYITTTVKYDNERAATVVSGYIPDLDQDLADAKGICYDYASLFAAMARSAGIPAKLLMGKSDYVKEYHAWNEVLLDGKWITIDTTVDAVDGNGTMAKDVDKYKATKVY